MTDAASEPLTASEAKLHCRVDTSDEDALFTRFIAAARKLVEKNLRRQLITATWTLTLDDWPSDGIRIEVCPLIAVSSITYLDTNGTQQTLASSIYRVDTRSEPGRITLEWGESMPALRGVENQITVTFTAGYGSSSSDVPETIKTAMLMLIGHWYDNRNAVNVGTMNDVPMAVKAWMAAEQWSAIH